MEALGESPGERYEELRRRLLIFFAANRHAGGEEAADETLDRVARRLAEGVSVGSVESFVLGVARNVVREGWKKPRAAEVDWNRVPAAAEVEVHPAAGCLEECLGKMAPASRRWVERFYTGNGGAKIRERAALAAELGIDGNALRVRMHRVRAKLEACVRGCMGGNEIGPGVIE